MGQKPAETENIEMVSLPRPSAEARPSGETGPRAETGPGEEGADQRMLQEEADSPV